MRSRTELVTTTFIDSEDDFTETDDSEEDWRPSASNRSNVKKRTHNTKGRNRGSRKRKSSATSSNGTGTGTGTNNNYPKKNRRQAAQDAIYQTFDDSDDEFEEEYEYYRARTQLAAEVEPKAIILPPKKKEKALSMTGNTASGVFQLFLYRKDLKEDYVTNSHLCLWRKDGTNLLQKYIRVKTGIPEEFLFTSSSVYSTWDEKRRRDFVTIAVKCHEENHRRVTFVNTKDLHSLARGELERLNPRMEDHDVEDDVENDESEENDDADAEYNSDVSEECEENNGSSFQPDDGEDDDGEIDCDEDNVEEVDDVEEEEQEEQDEPEEQVSEEDDVIEEEFDDFEQLDEEDDDVDEENDDDDKENQYESEQD